MDEVENTIREDDSTSLLLTPARRVVAPDNFSPWIERVSRFAGQSFFSTEGRR
jgi:hypothetical protein